MPLRGARSVAQPFSLRAEVRGHTRRHTRDYLWTATTGHSFDDVTNPRSDAICRRQRLRRRREEIAPGTPRVQALKADIAKT
jgi:hypothetical protein